MRFFICTNFEGIDFGSCAAVVVAADEFQARSMLLKTLSERNMTQSPEEADGISFTEIYRTKPQAIILANGA